MSEKLSPTEIRELQDLGRHEEVYRYRLGLERAAREKAEGEVERLKLWKTRKDARIKLLARAFRNSMEWLRNAEAEAARLQTELHEATKAGTPFWRERDYQNALILENQRLREVLCGLFEYDRVNTTFDEYTTDEAKAAVEAAQLALAGQPEEATKPGVYEVEHTKLEEQE